METLLELGFTREQISTALRLCNGNADDAANLLFANAEGTSGDVAAAPSASETTRNDDDEECKMVLAVRTDLGMGVGKMCAQCAHAAVDLFQQTSISLHPQRGEWLQRWLAGGCAKIALQVSSLSELKQLHAAAKERGLPCVVVQDAGRTQVAAGSETVLGVGPAPRSRVDQVTGRLQLL